MAVAPRRRRAVRRRLVRDQCGSGAPTAPTRSDRGGCADRRRDDHRIVETEPRIAQHATALGDAAALIGSPATTVATVGGNLPGTSPAMDLGPPLLALGATVELASLAVGAAAAGGRPSRPPGRPALGPSPGRPSRCAASRSKRSCSVRGRRPAPGRAARRGRRWLVRGPQRPRRPTSLGRASLQPSRQPTALGRDRRLPAAPASASTAAPRWRSLWLAPRRRSSWRTTEGRSRRRGSRSARSRRPAGGRRRRAAARRPPPDARPARRGRAGGRRRGRPDRRPPRPRRLPPRGHRRRRPPRARHRTRPRRGDLATSRPAHPRRQRERHALQVEPGWTLLRLLRDELELTGAKEGCDDGEGGPARCCSTARRSRLHPAGAPGRRPGDPHGRGRRGGGRRAPTRSSTPVEHGASSAASAPRAS